MRHLLALCLALWVSAPALADPSCVDYRHDPIPPELRIQVWSKFLQDNPNDPNRATILKEIDQALAELWGKPNCADLLRDATVNPFKDVTPSNEKKKPTKVPTNPDGTFDPFVTLDPFDGGLVNPFRGKVPVKSDNTFDSDGTFDPFRQPTPQGPKGPKGPKDAAPVNLGDGTLDPFHNTPAPAKQAIPDDGTLVDPFRKKKP